MQSPKRPHFIHSFDPLSNPQQLIIPSKFVKHFEAQASGTVTLVGPSGKFWLVDLIQQNDDLFFHNGWSSFVQDHFLEHGDTLVFGYIGNLYFTVQIFDQNSCEKEVAFSAECSQDQNHIEKLTARKRERENVPVSLDDIFGSVPKKLRGSDEWHVDELASVDETNQVNAGSIETGNCFIPSKSANISFAMPLQSTVEENSLYTAIRNVGGKKHEPDSASGSLSTSEAEELARSFSSSYPNFTKTMKAFNISGSYTLNIPYQFSMEHLPDCKIKMILRNLKGETWTVNSIPTTKVNMSHTLCGGWCAFVRDNNIHVGDICIFELVGECELRVYILRVGNEGLERQNGKPVVKGLSNKCAINSRHFSASSRKKMEGDIVLQKKVSRAKSVYGKSAMVNSDSLKEKQGLYTKSCMSQKSVPEEKFAAEVFVSTLPHFVRVMKKFNISGSYTLKVPYQFSMTHLPNRRIEIVLRNLKGQVWVVNSVPSTRVQTLHTFCGGWMAFVRGNDIQMGDVCIFELISKYEMRVHITSAGRNELDCPSAKTTSNGRFATSVSNL